MLHAGIISNVRDFCVYLSMTAFRALWLIFSIVIPAIAIVENVFKRNNTLDNIVCPLANLDLGSFRKVSRCAAMCNMVATCKSFFYNKDDRLCKGAPGILTTTVGCEDIPGTAYYQPTDCTVYGSSYIEYENMTLEVDNIAQYLDVTLLQCKTYCSALPTCRGFNYNTISGRCRLKNETPYTSPHAIKSYQNVNHYTKRCD